MHEINRMSDLYGLHVNEYFGLPGGIERWVGVAVRLNSTIPKDLTSHSEPHGLGHYMVDGFAPKADDCFYPFMRRVDDIVDMYHLGAWSNDGITYSPLWRLSPDGDVLGCTVARFDKKTGDVTEILREHGWTKDGLFWKSAWELRRMDDIAMAIDVCDFKAFFGGHLLKGNQKGVWVVQDELTALLGALAYPHYLWLAVGMGESLSDGMMGLLADSPTVTLWPNSQEQAERWKGLASCMGNCKVMETFAGGANMDDHLRQAVRKRYNEPPHDGAGPTF